MNLKPRALEEDALPTPPLVLGYIKPSTNTIFFLQNFHGRRIWIWIRDATFNVKVREAIWKQAECQEIIGFFFSFIHAATAAFILISFGHFSKLNPLLYCWGNLNTKLAFHDIAGFEQRAETAQSGTNTFREMIRSCIIHACSPTHLNPLAPSMFHFFKLSFQAKIMKSLLIQEYSSRRLAGLN